MVHESMRRSATGSRARRPQAVRASVRRRRTDLRWLRAITGALLLSSVALVGQALQVQAGIGSRQSAIEVVDSTAPALKAHHEPIWGSAASVRQGGDVTDATDAPVERSGSTRGAGPIRPTIWYGMAAAEYGVNVQLLEALHQVESNASPDACISNLEGSGATGPFQFKPATFSQFGVDANHDGVTDICGFADSLFSAARYLRAIGADHDPTSMTSRRALARYGTDVKRVVSLAQAYQERDGVLALASAPTTRE